MKGLLNLSFVVVCSICIQLAFAQNRIVGGHSTTIVKRPSLISLKYNSEFMCTASLLTAYCVLTAAHCCKGTIASKIVAKGGTKDLNGNGIKSNGKEHRFDGYNPNTLDHDRCIIRLSSPIKSSNVENVDLNSDPVNAGTIATVIGWGVTSQSSSQVPNTLREVDITVISKDKCNQYLPGQLTGSMMCALPNGKDACYGDSGGPLILKNGKQIGIVSWGNGCAQRNNPGVYTSVKKEFNWIKKTMKELNCYNQ